MSQNIPCHYPYPMISLSLLLHAHSQLGALQLTKGSFTFEEFQKALVFNVPVPKLFIDLNMFLIGQSAFIVEICPGIFQMNPEFIHQRIRFLENLLKVFDLPNLHVFNIPPKDINDIKKEILSCISMQTTTPVTAQSVLSSKGMTHFSAPIPIPNPVQIQNVQSSHVTKNTQHSPVQINQLDSSSSSRSFSRNELTPPMTRANSNETKLSTSPVPLSPLAPAEQSLDSFLAHIRKTGVDLLFPVSSQDLVIACIYSIINIRKCFFVKEIVDGLIAIKDSKIFPEFNEVSKTKFRGIIALLRHCDALIVENLSAESIQLVFHSNISSFADLRKFHDDFLLDYASKNQLELSETAKKEMFWNCDYNSNEIIYEKQQFANSIKHQIEFIILSTNKSQDSLDSQTDVHIIEPNNQVKEEQPHSQMLQMNSFYRQPYVVDNNSRPQAYYPNYPPEMISVYPHPCPPHPQYIPSTIYTPSPQPLPYPVQYQSIPNPMYSNYNFKTNPQLQGQIITTITPQVLQQSQVPPYIRHQNMESSRPVVPFTETIPNQYGQQSSGSNPRPNFSANRNFQAENATNSHYKSNNTRRQYSSQNRAHFSKK